MANPLELEIVIKVNDMASAELSSLAGNARELDPLLAANSQLPISPAWLELLNGVAAGLIANSITGAITSQRADDDPRRSNALGRYFQAFDQTYQIPEFIGRQTDSILNSLFGSLADSFERGLEVDAAMELVGASYKDTVVATTGERGYRIEKQIIHPIEGEISQDDLLERAAQKTRALAFAQQEAAEMARAFTYEQKQAANSVIKWNEINPAFLSAMGAQMDQVELLTLGFGQYQRAWDEAFEKMTFDGEVTAEEFERLTGLQKELGLAMQGTQLAAGLLSETSLLEWAEGIGISSEIAAGYISLITGAGDNLQFVLDAIANGESPALIAAQLETMNEVGGPPLSELAGQAGKLERHLRGVPSSVNSKVNVSFIVDSNIAIDKLLKLGISLGMARAIVSELDPELQASGGPLADLALVGEEGPELIIDGIVIPAQETRKLMALGLLPKRRFAFGGPLIGGGGAVSTALSEPLDFDPLNLDQRAWLRSARQRASSSAASSLSPSSASRASRSVRRERQTNADVALAIEAAVSNSVAAAIPDAAIAASQAAAAVAPSTLNSATQQLTRDLGRDIALSNERLMGRVDQLILETRRMKIYFRDAVRLLAN